MTRGLSRLPVNGIIFGLHAAEAALENTSRKVHRAYITENALTRLRAVIDQCGVAVVPSSPADIDTLIGGEAIHQGVVLHVEPLDQPVLEDFLASLSQTGRHVLAVLDQVTDPHNVGAVFRSAAAFGVRAVIVQSRHSAPLSGNLVKTASGGLEHVAMIEVVNLAQALSLLKDHDFTCIGFDSDASDPFSPAIAQSGRLALVFGAEDKGLRRLVRERCTRVCKIPVPGAIRSLNISNAAAIAFYEASRDR